jgi:UDP-N-acetyl-D-mannosaminuronic acid dehydrogenase
MNELTVKKERWLRLPSVDDADVTVVGGGGHVGLPLVLSLAALGLCVNVNDINEGVLDVIRSGRLPFMEYDAAPLLTRVLAENRLVFTSSPSNISKKGPVIITIGTPIDEFLNPIRQVVQECIDALLPHLADGQLIVLRSTIFPGTTDWIDTYIKRRGRTVKVAFCPERVVQGYGVKELKEMPQIVSGTTPEAVAEASALFRPLVRELVVVTPIEAEFAKLFTNAYRYIEFAATNQFYLIARSAGIDYHNVLKAMKHNYPRGKNIPRPGYAAGPCLLKDTMQLAAFARNEFSIGHAAMIVNEGLVVHVIDELRRAHDLTSLTIGLLGMAFKAEVDDTRASLSYKFKKMLLPLCREVLTTDPFVTTDPTLLPLDDVTGRSDLLILCTPHLCYKDADLKGKPVVDVWGFFDNANRSA